jgi:tetratricopeptide (TPR) repeat protein
VPQADPQPSAGVDPAIAAIAERFGAAMDEGRIADADLASAELFAMAAEQAHANPTPQMLRGVLADQAEAAGEWEVARQIYEQELDEALKDESLARPMLVSRARLHLARLQHQQGNHEAAFELASEAAAASRQGDLELATAMTLRQFAGFSISAGRLADAIAAVDEGLKLLGDRPMFALPCCQLWLRRSEASLAAGDPKEARRSLDRALAALRPPMGSSAMPGVQAAIADGWRLEGKLAATLGDWAAARAAWESALAFQRRVCDFWQGTDWRSAAELAKVLDEYAAAAEAAGDIDLAAALRVQSREIRSRKTAETAV